MIKNTEIRYDDKGNQLVIEFDDNEWEGSIYNSNGYRVRWDNSIGKWSNWTIDSNSKLLSWETSDGEWSKWTYDSKGDLVSEDSGKRFMNTVKGWENFKNK